MTPTKQVYSMTTHPDATIDADIGMPIAENEQRLRVIFSMFTRLETRWHTLHT